LCRGWLCWRRLRGLGVLAPAGFAPVPDDLACGRAVPACCRAEGADAHGAVGDFEDFAVDEAVLDPHEHEIVRRYPFDAYGLPPRLVIGPDSIGVIGGFARFVAAGRTGLERVPGRVARCAVFDRPLCEG
jgi:hypothetical protein